MGRSRWPDGRKLQGAGGLGDDRVGELPDLLDGDGHLVSGLQRDLRLPREADALGCAGEDDGSGQESRALRQEGDDLLHGEDHVLRVGLLQHLAVHHPRAGKMQSLDHLNQVPCRGADRQVVRVGNLRRRHQAGAQGAEGVKAFAPAPLAASMLQLLEPGRDIVGAHVALHVVQSLVLADVFAKLTDDNRQLALVIHLVHAHPRDGDGLPVADHGRRRLGEDNGKRWLGHVRLLSMLLVVQADAIDRGRREAQRRHSSALPQRRPRIGSSHKAGGKPAKP
mmetsp:Transcript_20314/g.51951  ORF Transcript_20314/g.51951 Transcript_20314/m.51951 type:complete len:280 (-) Transcript_20314:6-845(-)